MTKTVDSRLIAAVFAIAGFFAVPCQADDYVVSGAGEHDLGYRGDPDLEAAKLAASEINTDSGLGSLLRRPPQDCLLAGAGPYDYEHAAADGAECVVSGAGEHDL